MSSSNVDMKEQKLGLEAASKANAITPNTTVAPSERGDDHESESVKSEDVEKATIPASTKEGKEDDDIQRPEILSKRKFLPLFVGMILSLAMFSLDNTIVATAQVPIVTALHGEALITWLPTTYLIGQCSFTLFFGQILTIFPSKPVYLLSVFLFSLGSLVSGVAPNMGAMLSGRTISGIGAAGIFMSMMQVMMETTTLVGRALYMGVIGMIISLTMVVGPIIGGALADKASWRWCFYINLPIGGITALAVLTLFNTRPPLGTSKTNRPSQLKLMLKLDYIGLLLLTGIVCMVVIPMQEAQQNGWTSAATLAPICLTPVVAILTAFWFKYRQATDESKVILPLRMFKDLNFVGCAVASFLVFWIVIENIYLIPFFYETVLGHSALNSGVDMLALVIVFGFGAAIGGVIARKTGHYYPQFILCPLVGIVASGLMYTIDVNSTTAFHVGTQILLGVGIGPLVQGPTLAFQANCEEKKFLARAMSFVAFGQRFGGAIGSSLTGAVLAAQLPIEIEKQLRPLQGVDVSQYENISYNAIRSLPQGPVRDALLRALTIVIDKISIASLPLFAVLFFIVLFMIKIRNIKTQKLTSKRQFVRKVLCIPQRHPDANETAA